MKKIAFILTLITVSLQSFSQETVPKELLLSTLNSVSSLKFDTDKVTRLMDYNKGFVDKVYDVLNSDKEEKNKKESLDALSTTREADLHAFLTNHETNKYIKYLQDAMKPLEKQEKLLKHIAQ